MARPLKKAVAERPPAEEFDFTKSFQKLKPESFWSFLQQYPSWEAAAVYVYRLWPVIDRKLTGNKAKYIGVYPSPITAEDLLNEHGSGKYRLHLNDSNRAKAAVQVATCDVHLDDPDRRPILNPRELVIGDDRNKSYIDGLKARGQWNEDQDAAAAGTIAATNPDLSRVLEKAIDRIAEKPSEPPPQSAIESLKSFIELQQLLQPKTQQTDPWEIALKIATLVQRKDEPKQDPVEAYLRVAEVLDKRTPAHAAGGDGWVSVVMAFLQALPSIAQMFLASRSAGAPPPAATNVPVVLNPVEENAMAQSSPASQLFAELKPFLIKSLMNGQGGDEFAAGLITFLGREKYDQICALGPDGILDQVKAMADVWPMLEPFSMEVRKFIGDFIEYGSPAGGSDSAAAEVTQ